MVGCDSPGPAASNLGATTSTLVAMVSSTTVTSQGEVGATVVNVASPRIHIHEVK